MLTFISVNWWAVAAATAASMVIGSLWYSPLLFQRQWVALTPWIAKKSMADMKGGMMQAMVVGIVMNIVMAYVLAIILRYTSAHTPMAGAVTGLWIGIGFIATMGIQGGVYSWKPAKLTLIEIVHIVATIVAMGAVIGGIQ